MIDDPIIDELYRQREAFAKRFNFDVKAMVRHIRENSTVPAEKRVVLTPRSQSSAQEPQEPLGES